MTEPHPDREQEEIEEKLLEGLRSPAVPMGKNFWRDVRYIAHARAKAASRERSQNEPATDTNPPKPAS